MWYIYGRALYRDPSPYASMSSQRSLEALPDGLQLLDKVIDVIQASCLLLMYSRANFEGSYHASSAAALTTQTNLGRKAYSHTRNWRVDAVESDDSDLKPPKNNTLSVESKFISISIYPFTCAYICTFSKNRYCRSWKTAGSRYKVQLLSLWSGKFWLPWHLTMYVYLKLPCHPRAHSNFSIEEEKAAESGS